MTPYERAAEALEAVIEVGRDNGELLNPKACALAFLQAIREPSDTMEDAAYAVPIDTGHGFDAHPNPRQARSIWQAMIDVALEECR